jgi:hypothetical protein
LAVQFSGFPWYAQRVLSLWVLGALAADAGSVAVLPIRVEDSARDAVPGLIDEVVLAAVQDRGVGRVIGKDDVDALLGFDQQRRLAGCDEGVCFAELGGALGVERLVDVKIARAGDDWAVAAKLIYIPEARVERRLAELVVGDATLLLKSIPGVIERLFDQTAPAPAPRADRAVRVEEIRQPDVAALRLEDRLSFARAKQARPALGLEEWMDERNRESIGLYVAELIAAFPAGLALIGATGALGPPALGEDTEEFVTVAAVLAGPLLTMLVIDLFDIGSVRDASGRPLD